MFGTIVELLSAAVETFDETFQDTPAHTLVLATAALYFLYNQYHNPWIARAFRARHSETPKQRILDAAYGMSKNFPLVQKYLDAELNKNLQSLREKLELQRKQMTLLEKIPETGRPPAEILKQFEIDLKNCLFNFESIKEGDKAREFILGDGDGQDSGALYTTHPQELIEALKEVYAKTELTNPMHDKWPRINAMQAEIIRWCQNLFHGSDEGYGLLTHGGTSSIIEAMAAYVIHARARGIMHPEIVVPETAHAAFKKAADLTGATLITVPVDKKTGAVTAETMRKYISSNTAVMVGSAPSFMNGINDPIEDLGKLAQEKNVPFHVDACLGGFLTAFLDTSEAPMDFRVPGVTSISADTHKYGFCSKGTSVCLFAKNSPALAVYAALNWCGGLYTTPGILDGSTSGARVAEVYTTLSYYGRKRYQEIAETIVKLRQSLQTAVTKLIASSENIKRGDIYVYGDPKWSVLGFRSDTLNPHLIADELDKRGWKLNLLQNPAGFHLCLTHVHTLVKGFEDKFIKDLIDAVNAVKQYPANKKPSGNVKVYGTVGMMPTAVQEAVCIQYQKERLKFKGAADSGFFAATTDLKSEENMQQNIDGVALDGELNAAANSKLEITATQQHVVS
ncbi:pyridoxal phosphate-dependent decarboxylase family protein [Legionella hackeliae]|uniref:Sphingosine-1-phosphate lyase n=1 Tax=Legionella hackeliae TaxID=449 RepID=A0A0A8UVE2_LEGHA|nr:aminotransferase class V-fold PLP-dependent enzyme [Legionella hackeliae]KTD11439.1 sphingosine-1-phosphate lyase I [Legionella hackeliae]CEK10729.1 sphingosine-1-phosphate lyase [Legionella hackeliae]STX47479.1 sphingosine-1-phosphate lyase I [Legionella hackeliae]